MEQTENFKYIKEQTKREIKAIEQQLSTVTDKKKKAGLKEMLAFKKRQLSEINGEKKDEHQVIEMCRQKRKNTPAKKLKKETVKKAEELRVFITMAITQMTAGSKTSPYTIDLSSLNKLMGSYMLSGGEIKKQERDRVKRLHTQSNHLATKQLAQIFVDYCRYKQNSELEFLPYYAIDLFSSRMSSEVTLFAQKMANSDEDTRMNFTKQISKEFPKSQRVRERNLQKEAEKKLKFREKQLEELRELQTKK